MKKSILFLAGLTIIFCAGAAQAATATPPATATPSTATAATATPQQNRMKSCAAQYHQKGIAKSQYHTFMSGCLKGSAATAAVTPTKPAAAAPAAPAKN